MPTLIRLKGSRIVIVVGPELDDFLAEVQAAEKGKQSITLTPLYHGNDKTGQFLPDELITINPKDVRDMSETPGPIILADGRRMPQRWWWGGSN